MAWTDDKRWSDKFLPQIKRILGEHLIAEAPVEEDAERNTDLIVLRLEAIRIACRVRHYEYLVRYPDDITIRSGRPSGVKTELTKIVEGWGDYFFYGFSNEDDTDLISWKLCDLNVFRVWFNRMLVSNKGILPGIPQKNGDGSSSFIAFRARELPNEFIKAQSITKEAQCQP